MFQGRQKTDPSALLSESFITIVFLLLGVGILLPWNAYISAKQYFVSRLCSLSENGGIYSNIDQSIEMWFSIIYNGASVLSLAVVILVQHLVDSSNSNNNSNSDCLASRASKGIRSIRSLIFKNTKNLSISMMSSRTSLGGKIDTRHTREYATWYMVMIPLAVYLVVFAASTLMVFFTSISSEVFLLLNLCGLFICGACTAIATTGIVGTAGLFPATLGINPFFNGQAMGGLFVACANFAASVLNGSVHFMLQYCSDKIASGGAPASDEGALLDGEQGPGTSQDTTVCVPYEEVSLATAGYFFMGTFVLAACMMGYDYIDRYKRCVRRNSLALEDTASSSDEADTDDTDHDSEVAGEDEDEESSYLLEVTDLESYSGSGNPGRNDHSSRSNSMIPITSYHHHHHHHHHQSNENDTGMRQVKRQDSTDTELTNATESTRGVLVSVWCSVRGIALSLFVTYFCTLAIFPAWTSELISAFQCKSSSRIRNDLFVPLSFVIFNGGDLVGRYLSGAIRFEKVRNLSSKLVWASTVRTFLFCFVFLFCRARTNRFRDWIPVDNDVISWIIQFMFAVTNGLLTNIAFCYAPSLVENRSHPQQVASAILNLAMTFGLLVGSFFSGPFLRFALGT
eukprot:CAMPEP_0172361488 /NCGR_PEP_ID=MMETSP1060-20121228/5298_1 /TAXON_ID=37318 /ORGANISM="Pseudo-nitzschia pungens, Strain cf. cingulata" /LENGTH=625 /DNA_ID=CAMNT_0013083743 /DNA_START=154 /DNA_END=2031 /DNA_ORIENTATION=+